MDLSYLDRLDITARTIECDKIIARIDYLESLEPDEIDGDETEELAKLLPVKDSVESGCVLIRDCDFKGYIREMYQEQYNEILDQLPEFIRHAIDWDQVASDSQSDYTDIELDDTTYWMM